MGREPAVRAEIPLYHTAALFVNRQIKQIFNLKNPEFCATFSLTQPLTFDILISSTERKEKEKMIYCGYQGCGKSTYCREHPNTTIDLDSSMFTKRAGWEEDYVMIAKALSDYGNKNVFISAHKVVINYLIDNHIDFELLIPVQNPKAWRNRLEFRYNLYPTQANMNAILDFDKHYEEDMAFYETVNCKKHYISAKVVTDISYFIE